MSVGLLALAVVGAFATALDVTPSDKIVVIVIDDAGPELFGVYDTYYAATTGQPSGLPAATPAIDSMLAAQGVTFAHAWANPTCSPTRATILTGRYVYRCGVGDVTAARPTTLRTGLSYDEVLLPEPLRQAATPYRSLALGKWHLADRFQLDADPLHPLGSPVGRWFEGWAGTLFTSPTPDGFDPAVYGYSIWKKSFAGHVNSRPDPCAPAGPPCTALTIAPPMLNYTTADTAEDAIQCLRESTGPLFLYVAFNAIHTPLHDTPSGLPQPTCPQYTPPSTPCDFTAQLPIGPARARCMLEALDAQIGRILCEVDFNDTTVILIGDNGTAKKSTFAPYTPSHAKTTMYEGGLRVPLIVRSPVIPAASRGTMQTAPVQSVDLYATVCELAGVANPPSAVDSVSIVPYLEGANDRLRHYVYAEDFFPHFTPDPSTHEAPAGFAAKHHSQAICDGRFKLIRVSRRNTPLTPVVTEKFFDLLEGGPMQGSSPTPDYFEQNDLLVAGHLSSEAAGALASLRATLDTEFPFLTR